MHFFKGDGSHRFACVEESLTLSLHTLLPSRGKGPGATMGAWLQGENEWQK